MPYPTPTPIYHITHVDNLPNMLAVGGLHCKAKSSNQQQVNIAHSSVQSRRSIRAVPLPPHGFIHDYVPFYFAPRSPMLYVISRGEVAAYGGSQREVVHLVSTVQAVAANGLDYVFTDGHAIMALSNFYKSLEHLSEVDWPLMAETYWRDTLDDMDRKRRRQAEFLVYDFFSWSCITEIGVVNSSMQRRVQGLLGASPQSTQPPVTVRREWYY